MPFRLDVVSFPNARPLVEGPADDPRVELVYDVPSRPPAVSPLNPDNAPPTGVPYE